MTQFNNPNAGTPIVTAYQKTVKNCMSLIEAGQYDSAIAMLEGVIKQSPRDIQVLRMLGNALMMVDLPEPAIRRFQFAIQLSPGNPDIYCDLASALRRVDQVGKAHQAIDAALKAAPNYPRAIMVKARLLQSHGQSPRAHAIVKEALEKNFNATLLSTFGQLCRELKDQSAGIDMVRKGLEDATVVRVVRQDLLFVLGHLLDSVGEYDEAFECFSMGNSMSDEGEHLDFDQYLERWEKDAYSKVPSSSCNGSRSVMIVGMPRSGTTLTEQIIASHPNAGGIGESQVISSQSSGREMGDFDQAHMDKSGKAYLDMLGERFSDRSIKRICDKMPENFFYTGFITKALPGSHIIHCRRNPIDTCLSIYFQRFGPRIVYAMDMHHCAQQYLAYVKVMEYAVDTLGIEMHEAVYEQTTANPEKSIRSMLEYIGLPFDQSCMDFHKSKKAVHTASASQIRQPMYTSSTQRWKNYEKHLGPMIEILGPVLEE
ncbi:MAG: sulfotransferase [Phycisphaerales bacterium]|nr:sulfotransferase [Phycisphaerales bacterium]